MGLWPLAHGNTKLWSISWSSQWQLKQHPPSTALFGEDLRDHSSTRKKQLSKQCHRLSSLLMHHIARRSQGGQTVALASLCNQIGLPSS